MVPGNVNQRDGDWSLGRQLKGIKKILNKRCHVKTISVRKLTKFSEVVKEVTTG